MLALETFFVLFLFHGIVFSRSIGNSTADEGKSVADILERVMKNLTELETKIEKLQAEKKRVFFYAKMSSTDVTYNRNSIVKFNNVLNNEGNHFNPGDSVFVAPVSGVYMFSWTTQSQSSKVVGTELRVDNVVKDTPLTNLGSSGHLSVTRVVVCRVKKDDHVWIQTSNYVTENYFDYDGYSQSSFMGILLYET